MTLITLFFSHKIFYEIVNYNFYKNNTLKFKYFFQSFMVGLINGLKVNTPIIFLYILGSQYILEYKVSMQFLSLFE